MKKIALALVVALLLPVGAYAFDPGDLAALVAMPLAVAAVADVSGVPTSDLVNVVSAMNRANVPPPQFVEVIRYVPVALVEQPRDTQFVTYVDSQVDNGIAGDELAYGIANQLQTYGVRDINISNPPDIVVIDRYNYVPPVVIAQLSPVSWDPVSLVAMPLAVAAVSQLTNVPTNQLVQLVAALNGAYVPPAQFVEIVRYSPAVFVDTNYGPQFVPFVTMQVNRGIVGPQLVSVIQDQYQTWGVPEVNLTRPVVRVVDNAIPLPRVVTTRVAQAASGNPFGGPPGQLKKQLGLQTGAEVVHGEFPGRRIAGYHEERVAVPPIQERHPMKINRGHSAEVQMQPRFRGKAPAEDYQQQPPPRVKKQHGRFEQQLQVLPQPPRVIQQPRVMQQPSALKHPHGPGGVHEMEMPQGPAAGGNSAPANPGNGGGHGHGNGHGKGKN